MHATCLAIGVIVLSNLFGVPAFADDDEGPKPVELTISGQAIETPLLKYRLLPIEPELHAGNASPIYLRTRGANQAFFGQDDEELEQWATKPLDDPAWKENQNMAYFWAYDELKRAAFRRDASWEFPISEEPMFSVSLPDQAGIRRLRTGLIAKCRYHLSRGEFDQGREAVLVGLAMCRHVARTPFMVVQLSSSTGARALLDRVGEMAGLPGSPNLYWALTALPRPMFDVRRSAELEQAWLQSGVPGLADLDRPRSPAEWHELRLALFKGLAELLHGDQKEPPALDSALLLKAFKADRATWAGKTKDHAEMSDDEAMVRGFVWLRDSQTQKGTALVSLPYHQAIPAVRQFNRELEDGYARLGLAESADPNLLASDLKEAVAVWSIERKIDALRVVEAVRDFAAAHEGKLPEKLTDITALSIPVDPLTGESFGWAVKDNVGRLSAQMIEGVKYAPAASLEYVLRIR